MFGKSFRFYVRENEEKSRKCCIILNFNVQMLSSIYSNALHTRISYLKLIIYSKTSNINIQKMCISVSYFSVLSAPDIVCIIISLTQLLKGNRSSPAAASDSFSTFMT